MDIRKKKTFAEKGFIVLNRAPEDTLSVFFGKIIYYFFSTSKTSGICINSKKIFGKYAVVVKNILCIL